MESVLEKLKWDLPRYHGLLVSLELTRVRIEFSTKMFLPNPVFFAYAMLSLNYWNCLVFLVRIIHWWILLLLNESSPVAQWSRSHLQCWRHAGDTGSIPGLGRSPREWNGNLLQYSCLGNPVGRGAWWATVTGSQGVGHDWATQ